MVSGSEVCILSCILVIEGNASFGEIITEFLINCGHEVLFAENGKVGLEMCSKTVDFIITPLLMPEKDGLEVIMEVKGKWPSIEIIVLGTVWGRAPDIDLLKIARSLGASYILEQPLNLSEMVTVVNRLQMAK